jgi:sulfate adenylyltransferase subunit 1 (EFTu-like GTPase family)
VITWYTGSQPSSRLNVVNVRNSAAGVVDAVSTRGTGGVHIARGTIGVQPLLLVHDGIAIVVLDSEAKTSRVNALVAEDQERTEAGLGQEVKNTVEDGFRVGRDDIAALAKTPCDGIQDPQEGSQAAAHEEGALDIGTVVGGVTARFPDELVYNVDESEAA